MNDLVDFDEKALPKNFHFSFFSDWKQVAI